MRNEAVRAVRCCARAELLLLTAGDGGISGLASWQCRSTENLACISSQGLVATVAALLAN